MSGTMTAALKKLAGLAGLDIARVEGGIRIGRQPAKSRSVPFGGVLRSKPPQANFDNIALVLEHFSTVRPGAVFVQIGANDGETSDSVNTFVKRGIMRSVLVEPIGGNFRKLVRFYEGVPNVQLVQAAIAHQPGRAVIYAVRDTGRWKDNAWATQLASFDRDHLLRHGITAGEIEETDVECVDFPTLMARHGLDRIDVLQIDVEGFDAEVVRMALALPEPPLVICFEFVQFIKHMDQSMVNAFYALLREKGYAWSHDRINTMAVHGSFIRSGEPAMRV